ncbi:hypothetical protein Pla22_07880 [Rubripirellula amarantea]|uniref:Squalene cyclase C-terminal domain-containing protein n=1 Tax=Rubripirellula amarantea TaxID=2527999 RepID=A0A5C5WRS7_9BACT|nr:hypothetical protein [Rubripirellula amarantea]TWT53160.1 hypothetical protein Pla22_07880 [Rubripirellula amarantea]
MDTIFHRRGFLASVVTIAAGYPAYASTPLCTLRDSLASYLRASQQSDGRWVSPNYGVLRSGQAMTPFVLEALLTHESQSQSVSASTSTLAIAPSSTSNRALDWIAANLRGGCLGMSDPDVMEYPVYATSLALKCFIQAGRIDSQPAKAMRAYLIGQQFNQSRGFERSHLAYGGWGFGGVHIDGQTGHMDIVHTRLALEAIAVSGPPDTRCFEHAKHFLRLMQKHPNEDRHQPTSDAGDEKPNQDSPPFDGGFYFSPVVLGANKGRVVQSKSANYFRSYATATCDGVLALLAAGVSRQDPRVVAAENWLTSKKDWSYPEGIPRDYPEPWGEAVYFYHQAVRAAAYRHLNIDGPWREDLCERIQAQVRLDGSIVNQRSSLMKEDDPVMCTALALHALNQ